MKRLTITVIAVLLLVLSIIFIFRNNEDYNGIKHIIKKKYSRESDVEKRGDTLILKVQFSELESRNYASALILRDLIYFDCYEDMIGYTVSHYKFNSLNNANEENLILQTTLTKKELSSLYEQHKCKVLLETKQYIFNNCDIKWVEYGNTLLVVIKENKSDLLNNIEFLTSRPDIVSLMVGYAIDCCNFEKTDRSRLLMLLEDLKANDTLWYKTWPDYGNHIGHILKY